MLLPHYKWVRESVSACGWVWLAWSVAGMNWGPATQQMKSLRVQLRALALIRGLAGNWKLVVLTWQVDCVSLLFLVPNKSEVLISADSLTFIPWFVEEAWHPQFPCTSRSPMLHRSSVAYSYYYPTTLNRLWFTNRSVLSVWELKGSRVCFH